MRQLFIFRGTILPSYMKRIKLSGTRKSQQDGSMSNIELSPSNRDVVNRSPAPLPREKLPISSKLEDFSQESNREEDLKAGTNEEKQKQSRRHPTTTTTGDSSGGSNAHVREDDMKSKLGLKISETRHSMWSESGSDTLSFSNECEKSPTSPRSR